MSARRLPDALDPGFHGVPDGPEHPRSCSWSAPRHPFALVRRVVKRANRGQIIYVLPRCTFSCPDHGEQLSANADYRAIGIAGRGTTPPAVRTAQVAEDYVRKAGDAG